MPMGKGTYGSKRGRPPKIQNQMMPKIGLSTKRKRGRPRLVIPANEIRALPATVKKSKTDVTEIKNFMFNKSEITIH